MDESMYCSNLILKDIFLKKIIIISPDQKAHFIGKNFA